MTEQEIREICLKMDDFDGEESSMSFFSCSQYKRFVECEAKALAMLKHEWIEAEGTALLFGKYFHSYFESPEAFQKFCEENASKLYKKNGELYADFAKAEPMFRKINSDKMAMHFATGIHEVKIRGMIGEHPWRGCIDVLNVQEGWFCDLKAVANIYEGEWKVITCEDGIQRNRKVSFIESYEYHRQMAIYRHMLKEKFGKEFAPVMLVVSKQEFPDIELIGFQKASRLDMEIQNIILNQPAIINVKSGTFKCIQNTAVTF